MARPEGHACCARAWATPGVTWTCVDHALAEVASWDHFFSGCLKGKHHCLRYFLLMPELKISVWSWLRTHAAWRPVDLKSTPLTTRASKHLEHSANAKQWKLACNVSAIKPNIFRSMNTERSSAELYMCILQRNWKYWIFEVSAVYIFSELSYKRPAKPHWPVCGSLSQNGYSDRVHHPNGRTFSNSFGSVLVRLFFKIFVDWQKESGSLNFWVVSANTCFLLISNIIFEIIYRIRWS